MRSSKVTDLKAMANRGRLLRLGLYPCKLKEGTKASAAYGEELIYERHRHRYEFNNEYRERFEEGRHDSFRHKP